MAGVGSWFLLNQGSGSREPIRKLEKTYAWVFFPQQGPPSIFLMNVKLFFFWNLRGLNDPDKHRNFSDWLSSYRSIFGALLETHINELYLPRLMSTLCRDWHYVSNHLSDDDGRIVLISKDPAKVRMISQSKQMITCEVELPNSTPTILLSTHLIYMRKELTFGLSY